MQIRTTLTLFFILAWALPAAAQDFKVTLLGTGDPIPRTDRFGPATLVEVGGQELLFDVGRGASQRLVQMNIALSAVDAVFLTHFHHDHLVGLPDIWMTGWIPPPFGRRSVPFEVWGPTGTASMLENLEKAFELNTKIRIPDELLPPAGIEMVAHEFDADGVVRSPVRVTVIHNGVLIQNNVALLGPTEYIGKPSYRAHEAELPLVLQDHGNPVSFRNIWIRPL